MSPSPEVEVLERREGGFTLIEVIVALGIFMVLAVAVAPVLVGGLRSAAVARDVSQSKGVAQARLEQMRDLPFYVEHATGDFKDVLDFYYPDKTAPAATPSCASTTLTDLPATTWKGYVDTAATHCVWEPAGPLYRVVVNPVVAPGLGVFSMVISTQFLSGASSPTPVAPAQPAYNTTTNTDSPPTRQIGVTVAVFYKSPSGVHYTVTYSQIEQGNPIAPLVTSEAKATTVRASSALDVDTNLLEQLGVINLSGELFTGSRVVTTASAATAGDSLGQQINGAQANLVAPVDQPSGSSTVGGVNYPVSGCDIQCFGNTKVDQASALASNGLPRAGTATLPVRAYIPAGANNDGFRFSNGTAIAGLKLEASKPMVSLDTSTPPSMATVSGCAASASETWASYLTGTGYLDATSSSVAACGTAQANTIRIFPTTFAHDGVLRISIQSATASCNVIKPAGGTASAAYRATVQYWNGSGYTTLPTVSSTNTADPLAAVDLATVVDPGSGLKLGDYIASWRSLSSSGVHTSTTSKTAEASLPSAISITTKPTRDADPTSAISLDLGAVSCEVSDNR